MSGLRGRLQAERLIKQIGLKSAPIDVEGIAHRLGLRIVYGNLGSDAAGLLVNVTRGGVAIVCVQEDDPRVRQRFTIAHEIGHHLLGHPFEPGAHVHVDRGNLITQRNSRSAEGVDPKEIEANQFAASLLMPSALVRAHVSELPPGPIFDVDVAALAAEFQVSEQAMTIRLTALDLL